MSRRGFLGATGVLAGTFPLAAARAAVGEATSALAAEEEAMILQVARVGAALTADEANAGFALYDQVLTPTLGMTRQQLVDHMNRTEVTQAVYAILSGVPSLELHETIVLGS